MCAQQPRRCEHEHRQMKKRKRMKKMKRMKRTIEKLTMKSPRWDVKELWLCVVGEAG